MTENREKFVRADRVPTSGEVELALERLSPNWARAAPRPRTGGISYILQSLAHGRSHAVVLEIKRSPRQSRSGRTTPHPNSAPPPNFAPPSSPFNGILESGS